MSSYTLLYDKIKNSIKDLIITRLLDRVISQDKTINEVRLENELLKSHLLLILKQTIGDKAKVPAFNTIANSNTKYQKTFTNKSFLSPNSSNLGINKLNVSKMTLTQYSSSDTLRLNNKGTNRINTLYKRNKCDLTLSPCYNGAKSAIDYDTHIKEYTKASICINRASNTNSNATTTNIEPKRLMNGKSLSMASTKNIAKWPLYKTKSVYSTPNKNNNTLHNKSYFGIGTNTVNTIAHVNTNSNANGIETSKAGEKKQLMIKIQKRIINKVIALNEKK